jgi:hypothetical protein
MSEFPDLEINEDIASENTVIEYKVHKEIVGVEREPFLPGFEEEA